jgi:ribonuclease HI
MDAKRVVIYTDGACTGNPGPGGYGAVIMRDGVRKELSGGYRLTTNNRMELQALVAALSEIESHCHLEIYSDSQYMIGGFKKGWVANWKRNGWQTAAKEPVQNRDLWLKLDSLLALHNAAFNWVRGHSSNPENNRCDELAVKAAHGKDLQEDTGYSPAPPPSARKPEPRAEKRPSDWDDDLFSHASANGGPVNWDF